MAHALLKSLVELSTDEHEMTFVNVIQMLSSLTHTPRLKWLDNLSPLHQPQKLYSKHPLLAQYNHLLLPEHPSKLQPEALQQQPVPSRGHLQLQMYNHQLAELMPHLTDLVVSVRHHNALLNRCKYTTAMMCQDQQVHPHIMDQDLKTFKDSAHKACLSNQSHTSTI